MDLETLDHVLMTTRSVKKRLDFTRPVEPAVIQRCIEIALQSPTGVNSQDWYFVQTALLPVAYFTGDDFKPAKRLSVEEVTYWNAWGQQR